MLQVFFELFLFLALCAAMIALQAAGHSVARRDAERSPDRKVRGLGAVEGAAFGLLALLLGFSFSSALARFEARNELIISESVVIGSTWQWLDVVEGPSRDELRAKFRDYVDARIQVYRMFDNEQERRRVMVTADSLQTEIWSGAIAVNRTQGPTPATVSLLSSLNEMFDLATKRYAAQRWHAPAVIFVLLVAMALCCSFLAGYSLAAAKRRNWIAMLAFAVLMTLTVYVIVDLEFPRHGLIQVDHLDALLEEVRASMG